MKAVGGGGVEGREIIYLHINSFVSFGLKVDTADASSRQRKTISAGEQGPVNNDKQGENTPESKKIKKTTKKHN